VLDKTGSLPVSFPVQIIYRIVSYQAPDSLKHAGELVGGLLSIVNITCSNSS